MAAAEVAIYLQAMLLPDADTFSMASSVELRVPFVDSYVFSAALESVHGRNTYLARRRSGRRLAIVISPPSRRGLSVVLAFPWGRGSRPLAPLVTATSEPDAPVWSLVTGPGLRKPGLRPLTHVPVGRKRGRWRP